MNIFNRLPLYGVRIENRLFTPEQNFLFSCIASVVRLSGRRPLYRFIGRLRRLRDPFGFHRGNITLLRHIAKQGGILSLTGMADEADEILNELAKENAK